MNLQMFAREISVWHQMEHANIVPFLGITFDFASNAVVPQAISPWMANGDYSYEFKFAGDINH
jgi:hypothetical protein